ncbi:MAG: hypothetical protein Q7K13_07740 [Polynucleobacter sp.]|uniref:hypothetical protein n=1 Tax=Polynucleobacter sp. TaxID=2029855 RepID=UPI002718CE51|nr:hypothetical protein [Polynucleobacter sp.]MDO8714353.1 hypothetical protein [Polynucleobacter sp.]
MSKVVQAVNAMITNSSDISNVIKITHELFFLYNKKYKWSMAARDGEYHLWFYPGTGTLESLVSQVENGDVENISMVHYVDTDIGTKEAKASFADLYTILSEKIYGIDEVLDDIISGDIPF